MVGKPIVSQWIDWWGPNADGTTWGTTTCHNVIDFIGVRDTGNGQRWIISSSNDQAIQVEGHNEGLPYEFWYYDLGPAEGVYDPELGYVGYKQVYVEPHAAVPTGQFAEEYWANIIPGSYHRNVGSLFRI